MQKKLDRQKHMYITETKINIICIKCTAYVYITNSISLLIQLIMQIIKNFIVSYLLPSDKTIPDNQTLQHTPSVS